jgi:hypothetical protein
LSLDDDLAQKVTDIARDSRRPFKAVLNDALRRGLGNEGPAEPVFTIHSHAGNLKPGIDDRSFNELAWEPEPRS